ncbi:MAG: hypothetical protein WC461_02975 [Candidatus Paceibacterota bacterium]
MDYVFEFIKEYRKDIIIFLLIFLLCSISFGLGYLVNREFNHAPIIIEKCSGLTN